MLTTELSVKVLRVGRFLVTMFSEITQVNRCTGQFALGMKCFAFFKSKVDVLQKKRTSCKVLFGQR